MKGIWKEFSLEDYKTGKYKVQTKRGYNVEILRTDIDSAYQILGVVNNAIIEKAFQWNSAGECMNHCDDGFNLVLCKNEFEDGDYVSIAPNMIGIFFRKTIDGAASLLHCLYRIEDDRVDIFNLIINVSSDSIEIANPEEIEKLDIKLQSKGYVWNAVEKEIQKLDDEYEKQDQKSKLEGVLESLESLNIEELASVVRTCGDLLSIKSK